MKIGECYNELNEVTLAYDNFRQCLQMRKAIYGNGSELLLDCLELLKICCKNLGKLDEINEYESEITRITSGKNNLYD